LVSIGAFARKIEALICYPAGWFQRVIDADPFHFLSPLTGLFFNAALKFKLLISQSSSEKRLRLWAAIFIFGVTPAIRRSGKI
jgi:hypothetical protein